MSRSRFCAVAAGDTPTSGRLYDAIACLCVPLVINDDLQLPFPATKPIPPPAFGVRISESEFLSNPQRAAAAEHPDVSGGPTAQTHRAHRPRLHGGRAADAEQLRPAIAPPRPLELCGVA